MSNRTPEPPPPPTNVSGTSKPKPSAAELREKGVRQTAIAILAHIPSHETYRASYTSYSYSFLSSTSLPAPTNAATLREVEEVFNLAAKLAGPTFGSFHLANPVRAGAFATTPTAQKEGVTNAATLSAHCMTSLERCACGWSPSASPTTFRANLNAHSRQHKAPGHHHTHLVYMLRKNEQSMYYAEYTTLTYEVQIRTKSPTTADRPVAAEQPGAMNDTSKRASSPPTDNSKRARTLTPSPRSPSSPPRNLAPTNPWVAPPQPVGAHLPAIPPTSTLLAAHMAQAGYAVTTTTAHLAPQTVVPKVDHCYIAHNGLSRCGVHGGAFTGIDASVLVAGRTLLLCTLAPQQQQPTPLSTQKAEAPKAAAFPPLTKNADDVCATAHIGSTKCSVHKAEFFTAPSTRPGPQSLKCSEHPSNQFFDTPFTAAKKLSVVAPKPKNTRNLDKLAELAQTGPAVKVLARNPDQRIVKFAKGTDFSTRTDRFTDMTGVFTFTKTRDLHWVCPEIKEAITIIDETLVAILDTEHSSPIGVDTAGNKRVTLTLTNPSRFIIGTSEVSPPPQPPRRDSELDESPPPQRPIRHARYCSECEKPSPTPICSECAIRRASMCTFCQCPKHVNKCREQEAEEAAAKDFQAQLEEEAKMKGLGAEYFGDEEARHVTFASTTTANDNSTSPVAKVDAHKTRPRRNRRGASATTPMEVDVQPPPSTVASTAPPTQAIPPPTTAQPPNPAAALAEPKTTQQQETVNSVFTRHPSEQAILVPNNASCFSCGIIFTPILALSTHICQVCQGQNRASHGNLKAQSKLARAQAAAAALAASVSPCLPPLIPKRATDSSRVRIVAYTPPKYFEKDPPARDLTDAKAAHIRGVLSRTTTVAERLRYLVEGKFKSGPSAGRFIMNRFHWLAFTKNSPNAKAFWHFLCALIKHDDLTWRMNIEAMNLPRANLAQYLQQHCPRPNWAFASEIGVWLPPLLSKDEAAKYNFTSPVSFYDAPFVNVPADRERLPKRPIIRTPVQRPTGTHPNKRPAPLAAPVATVTHPLPDLSKPTLKGPSFWTNFVRHEMRVDGPAGSCFANAINAIREYLGDECPQPPTGATTYNQVVAQFSNHVSLAFQIGEDIYSTVPFLTCRYLLVAVHVERHWRLFEMSQGQYNVQEVASAPDVPCEATDGTQAANELQNQMRETTAPPTTDIPKAAEQPADPTCPPIPPGEQVAPSGVLGAAKEFITHVDSRVLLADMTLENYDAITRNRVTSSVSTKHALTSEATVIYSDSHSSVLPATLRIYRNVKEDVSQRFEYNSLLVVKADPGLCDIPTAPTVTTQTMLVSNLLYYSPTQSKTIADLSKSPTVLGMTDKAYQNALYQMSQVQKTSKMYQGLTTLLRINARTSAFDSGAENFLSNCRIQRDELVLPEWDVPEGSRFFPNTTSPQKKLEMAFIPASLGVIALNPCSQSQTLYNAWLHKYYLNEGDYDQFVLISRGLFYDTVIQIRPFAEAHGNSTRARWNYIINEWTRLWNSITGDNDKAAAKRLDAQFGINDIMTRRNFSKANDAVKSSIRMEWDPKWQGKEVGYLQADAAGLRNVDHVFAQIASNSPHPMVEMKVVHFMDVLEPTNDGLETPVARRTMVGFHPAANRVSLDSGVRRHILINAADKECAETIYTWNPAMDRYAIPADMIITPVDGGIIRIPLTRDRAADIGDQMIDYILHGNAQDVENFYNLSSLHLTEHQRLTLITLASELSFTSQPLPTAYGHCFGQIAPRTNVADAKYNRDFFGVQYYNSSRGASADINADWIESQFDLALSPLLHRRVEMDEIELRQRTSTAADFSVPAPNTALDTLADLGLLVGNYTGVATAFASTTALGLYSVSYKLAKHMVEYIDQNVFDNYALPAGMTILPNAPDAESFSAIRAVLASPQFLYKQIVSAWQGMNIWSTYYLTTFASVSTYASFWASTAREYLLRRADTLKLKTDLNPRELPDKPALIPSPDGFGGTRNLVSKGTISSSLSTRLPGTRLMPTVYPEGALASSTLLLTPPIPAVTPTKGTVYVGPAQTFVPAGYKPVNIWWPLYTTKHPLTSTEWYYVCPSGWLQREKTQMPRVIGEKKSLDAYDTAYTPKLTFFNDVCRPIDQDQKN